MAQADVVVIGAGLSGLVCAILQAETGRRVVVLERHDVPGGYQQQFQRKGTVFDVGYHYMGSTAPGRPMRQFLEYLRIWDRLRLLPLPEDAAIEVANGARRFAYPNGWARFREKALAAWPHERAGLERMFQDIPAVTGEYKWFDLARGKPYAHPLDLGFTSISLAEYLRPLVQDPWLLQVLGVQAFNLGLLAHEAPWVKYALALRSNFDLTSRIAGGGGALVAALVERGRELGVDYHLRSEVVGFECAQRRVRRVRTADGGAYAADLFIAACHPKAVLARIRDEDVSPVFKERVQSMKDSRGALQVFLRLKELPRSLGRSCLMIVDEEEARRDPPIHIVLVCNPAAVEGPELGGPRLELMTFLEHAPFASWAGTQAMRRGAEYERFKWALAQRVIDLTTRFAPELPELIEDMYASTPLTDEWYTLNAHGAVFGVSHDVTQQGLARPLPRVRLRNLFFSGHSIQMPGICGVFINAFDTCEMLRGDGALFAAVAT
ncbi:MAG: NAD(P)/FAD-dependent oxidoreductase [Planctomycetes bacterium]|nr:NAD(P)/FAD-dependent oxidoreductase [Planctomycetota bacterium]